MRTVTRRGDAARAAIVANAERMFAEQGIEAVSLRDVCAAAGQRNHSAAQYHFGDRRGLVAAVYEARMRDVDARRHAYLDALRDAGCGDDVRGLVEAVVVPLVDVVAETDGWYARFLARTRWEPTAWQVVLELQAATSFATVMQKLDGMLTNLTPAMRRNRLDQLLTLVIGTIAGWEGAPERGARRLRPKTLASELVSTGVAVLNAPTRLELVGASTR